MEQAPLYSTIKGAGYSVLMFEDHPQFFGNWRAMVKRGSRVYEIVSDSREGWLSLWLHESGKGTKLFETESSKLGQEQELAQISAWLLEVPQ